MNRPTRSPFAPLVLAVACVSSAAVLIRFAQAPPLAVSFYRVALASALLLPAAAGAARRSWPALPRRLILALVAAGVALGVHFGTWIASLSYTTVAASVLLVNTAPVFTVLLSRVLLKEPAPPPVLAAIALALGGASLIALGDWGGGAHSLTGAGLAVAGAISLAIYHIVGRRLRAALPLRAYVLAVWATAAVVLGLTAAAAGVPLLGYEGRAWAAFVALAIVPTIGGHGLVNYSLRLFPAPTVGLFLLGEPIGASLLALALFGEIPGPWTLAGGAVILAALAAIVVWGTERPPASPED